MCTHRSCIPPSILQLLARHASEKRVGIVVQWLRLRTRLILDSPLADIDDTAVAVASSIANPPLSQPVSVSSIRIACVDFAVAASYAGLFLALTIPLAFLLTRLGFLLLSFSPTSLLLQLLILLTLYLPRRVRFWDLSRDFVRLVIVLICESVQSFKAELLVVSVSVLPLLRTMSHSPAI